LRINFFVAETVTSLSTSAVRRKRKSAPSKLTIDAKTSAKVFFMTVYCTVIGSMSKKNLA